MDLETRTEVLQNTYYKFCQISELARYLPRHCFNHSAVPLRKCDLKGFSEHFSRSSDRSNSARYFCRIIYYAWQYPGLELRALRGTPASNK
jgi:hypothetical protein